MTCFFRIHRVQYDLRGPKRAQNFVWMSVRTLIKSLVQMHSFKKAGPPPDSQIYRATHQLSECLGRMNAHKARCTQFTSIRCWLSIISTC